MFQLVNLIEQRKYIQAISNNHDLIIYIYNLNKSAFSFTRSGNQLKNSF